MTDAGGWRKAKRIILEALHDGSLGPGPDLQAKVVVAACLGAATTAVLTWTENDGTPELPDLMEKAFDTLAHLGSLKAP